MKLKTALATVAALFSASVFASDYLVVVPLKGKVAQLDAISVSLNGTTLPIAYANVAYTHDLRNLLMVTGDPQFAVADVRWSVTNGALPAGMALNAQTGVLSGVPTVVGASSFEVTATYKTKTGAQSFAIPVNFNAAFFLKGNEASGAFTTVTPTLGGQITAIGSNVAFDDNGLTFSNWSGVQLPTDAAVLGTGDFTIDFWVYYRGPTSTAYYTYSGFFENPSNNFLMWLGDSGYGNALFLTIPGATHIAWPAVTKGVLTNKWSHLAIVRDSGKVRLFLNGVPQDARDGGSAQYGWGTLYSGLSAGVPRSQAINESSVRLGRASKANTLPVNVSIKNFRISKSALWPASTQSFTPPQ